MLNQPHIERSNLSLRNTKVGFQSVKFCNLKKNRGLYFCITQKLARQLKPEQKTENAPIATKCTFLTKYCAGEHIYLDTYGANK